IRPLPQARASIAFPLKTLHPGRYLLEIYIRLSRTKMRVGQQYPVVFSDTYNSLWSKASCLSTKNVTMTAGKRYWGRQANPEAERAGDAGASGARCEAWRGQTKGMVRWTCTQRL